VQPRDTREKSNGVDDQKNSGQRDESCPMTWHTTRSEDDVAFGSGPAQILLGRTPLEGDA
jgi:hypothetical protein